MQEAADTALQTAENNFEKVRKAHLKFRGVTVPRLLRSGSLSEGEGSGYEHVEPCVDACKSILVY